MQSVNQHVFDTLLLEHFQAQEGPSYSIEVSTDMTAEEENILRYASGFGCIPLVFHILINRRDVDGWLVINS